MQKGVANFMMFDFVQRKNLRTRRRTPTSPSQFPINSSTFSFPPQSAIIRKRQNFYFKFKLTFWLARRQAKGHAEV